MKNNEYTWIDDEITEISRVTEGFIDKTAVKIRGEKIACTPEQKNKTKVL